MLEDLRRQNARLDAEIRVLREENLLLAEHAEEAMLLRTVAEVTSWCEDSDTLMNEVLERISILRNIPLCACGRIDNQEIVLPWCYLSTSAGDCELRLQVPPEFSSQFGGRNGVVVQLPRSGFSLENAGHKLEFQSLFLISFKTHIINRGIFVFASDEEGCNWSGPQIFLRQAVDTVVARLDRLNLVSELQSINQDLDRRVRERTDELQSSYHDLAQLQSLLENIINSMPSVLIGIDQAGCVMQWNQEATRLSGHSLAEAKGRLLSDVFPALHAQLAATEMTVNGHGTRKNQRGCLRTLAGERLLVDITVYPLRTGGIEGAVIWADDVTDRVRLEEMMIQAEKMLSVGGLAAGMAHEINNPLAGILQNLQVALNRLTDKQEKNLAAAADVGLNFDALGGYLEQRSILSMIRHAIENGQRAAGIVENILSFSRVSESKQSPHDLTKVVERTLGLLNNDYDLQQGYDFRQIKISREFAENLPPVACEETKIQQVLLNILRNGAQAMSGDNRGRSGRFLLRLKRHEMMAQLDIVDNGPGMSEEVRRRVFEPFFTTKGVGCGTGLGLSVSYFIIKEQHDGELFVESTPGRGSCFTIRLPFVDSGGNEQ